jgi:predicted dehydrogenase
MSKEQLRIGYIGVGGMAESTLKGAVEAKSLQLVAVCDVNEKLVKNIAAQYDVPAFTNWDEMMDAVPMDAVFISIPHYLHFAAVKSAVEHHLHIWKEKPLALDFHEANEIVGMVREKNLTLAIGTQRRFVSTFAQGKKLLSQLGEIFLVRGHYLYHWGRGAIDLRWLASREKNGRGALLALGYHTLDILLWYMGTPEEVYTYTAKKAWREPPYETEDTSVTMMKFPNGAIGYLLSTWGTGPNEEAAFFHGQESVLHVNWEKATLFTSRGIEIETIFRDENSPYILQAEDFANAVLLGKTPLCNPDENLRTMRVIEAAYRSEELGRPVKIEEIE